MMLLQAPPPSSQTPPARRVMPLIWLCLAGAVLPGRPVHAEPLNAAVQSSLVLCAPAAAPLVPTRAIPGSGSAHRLVRQIGDGRFFAPTRSAMFFSHPGDRCAWRGGLAIRG
ncbi:hypothetical protein [Lichenicola sp.]|uniref:hypothetical protein n=1 Tax=Lichenicola sp. TaxID=2804529 RepID=UPI003AFF7ECE